MSLSALNETPTRFASKDHWSSTLYQSTSEDIGTELPASSDATIKNGIIEVSVIFRTVEMTGCLWVAF